MPDAMNARIINVKNNYAKQYFKTERNYKNSANNHLSCLFNKNGSYFRQLLQM